MFVNTSSVVQKSNQIKLILIRLELETICKLIFERCFFFPQSNWNDSNSHFTSYNNHVLGSLDQAHMSIGTLIECTVAYWQRSIHAKHVKQHPNGILANQCEDGRRRPVVGVGVGIGGWWLVLVCESFLLGLSFGCLVPVERYRCWCSWLKNNFLFHLTYFVCPFD